MAKTLTINGKNYIARDFDFNTTCDLEDMGVSMADANKKPMSFFRAYFALCMGIDLAEAGAELQEHIANGGTLEELLNIANDKAAESGFTQDHQKSKKKITK